MRTVPEAKLPKPIREKLRIARDLIKKREVDAARTQLLEIEQGSSYGVFHRMMAACAFIAKDYDLTSAHIEQALALEPDNQAVIAEAILIYKKQKKIRRARELFESFDLNKASSGQDLYRMALAMKSLGQYTEAATVLDKAIRLAPANVRIRNQHGIILTHLGSLDEAILQWSFSLKYKSRDLQAMTCLGRAHLHRMEYQKAIDYFKDTLDSETTKSEGRKLNLAEAYVRASAVTQARELLSSVKKMENPRFHYLWGTLHYRESDYFLAYSSFSRCIELAKEKSNTVPQQISLPERLTSDDAICQALEDVRPQLDSLFDAFSLLKTAEDDPEPQAADDFSFQ